MTGSTKSSFKGTIGFVLAAAGSAVGLGNIWRFPYLAAKDGGGLFLVIYIALAVTFGFALLTTEISIGRKTKQSPLTAYRAVSPKWGWIGILACIIPTIIMPYYFVIGGWVLKYFVTFVTGNGALCAQNGFFDSFTSDISEPVIFMVIFAVLCALVIVMGVNGGIEMMSKILMPVLFLLILGIAIFSLTLQKPDDPGSVVTGLQGLKVFVVPDFDGITVTKFLQIVMDALGQLFYSLSIAMGILIAYGSYVPDKTNLVKAIGHIEIFDTVVAFLAGVMIIPSVFVFMGREGMGQGPSLMFVSLPKIFAEMGSAGNIIGTLFFGMVLFAAVTSGMSFIEAIVSSLIDKFNVNRRKGTVAVAVVAILIGVVVCLGYNILRFELKLPNGNKGQILDVMDYVSNQIMMPIVTIATCILIGWVKKPDYIVDEVTKNGEKFARSGIYKIMIRFIAPALVLILFLISLGVFG